MKKYRKCPALHITYLTLQSEPFWSWFVASLIAHIMTPIWTVNHFSLLICKLCRVYLKCIAALISVGSILCQFNCLSVLKYTFSDVCKDRTHLTILVHLRMKRLKETLWIKLAWHNYIVVVEKLPTGELSNLTSGRSELSCVSCCSVSWKEIVYTL